MNNQQKQQQTAKKSTTENDERPTGIGIICTQLFSVIEKTNKFFCAANTLPRENSQIYDNNEKTNPKTEKTKISFTPLTMENGGEIIPELVEFAEALSKKLTNEILAKLSEKLSSLVIDDSTKKVIKQSIEATINPAYDSTINVGNSVPEPSRQGIDSAIVEETKKEEKKTDDEELATITYAEAQERLGGDEEIEKFKEISDQLELRLADEMLDFEITQIIPVTSDWKAFSTKLINQPYVNNIDELYEIAQPVYPVFQKMIEDLAKKTNSIALIPPMKGKKRAVDKAHFKYKDYEGTGIAYYRVTDIIRGTMEFPDLPSMYKGVVVIFDHPGFEVREFNDRYQNPKQGGYRDIQFTVELNGFMCELQLSTQVMRQAKETSGHRNYEVYRELLAAVTDGNQYLVEAALDFGKKQLGSNMGSSFMRDENCRALPHQAAKNGQTEILDRLLDSGADPNAQDKAGDTPLHHATYNGHERCVWLLISRYKCKTDILNYANESALLKGYFMIYGGQPEPQRRSMITLLQAGDIEQVRKTSKVKDEIIRKKLINSCLLVDYASDGNADQMHELLKQFSDPNSTREGRTALQAAVRGGHDRAVSLLLKFKASLNNMDNIVQEALDNDHNKIADILRKSGAPCKGTKWKVLVQHAADGDVQKMKELLDLDVDPNSSCDGVTALRAAVREGHKNVVKLLLDHKASTLDREGEVSILQEAIDRDFKGITTTLVDSGACCKNIMPSQYEITCSSESDSDNWNWVGMSKYNSKLFCAPCNASSVLIIDGDKEMIRTIPCDIQGGYKWAGMARYRNKLFCGPTDASSILVIDGDTEEISTIPCILKGRMKFMGIARYGTKLFCAPYHASSVMIIDLVTEEQRFVECGVDGPSKWAGIAVCGSKLFCAPYGAKSVLVIDGETENVHTIPCANISGWAKWFGIDCYEKKLFCAPFNASSVLVIDSDTEKTYSIPCGVDGDKKWHSIARFGDKLVCAPSRASSILIIDGETDEVRTRTCIDDSTDNDKWSSLAQLGPKLFCCPASSDSILIIKDESLKLRLDAIKSRAQGQHIESCFLVDYASAGNVAELKKLLALNVDPNSSKDGITALRAAVCEGHQEAVQLLLGYGATTIGTSIVKEAMKLGYVEIVKILSDSGASCCVLVDHARDGKVKEMEELFTQFHVNPNSLSEDGVRALQAAVSGGHKEAVELLLKYKASTVDRVGETPILQEALDFDRSIDIAQMLVDYGASRDNVGPSPRTIPLGINDKSYKDWKWYGIVEYNNKLFCAPYNSSSILVIDGNTEEVRTIPCNIEGEYKWSGIARYKDKLFCAPCGASSVLVINGDTEEIHTIPCDVIGFNKWMGIARYGTKLFCAPCGASSVLVIDGETEKLTTISCGMKDVWKWVGIEVYGTKLFCAPHSASRILVIDGESQKISYICCNHGEKKYNGIACYKNKLYCGPYHASSVLVIDGETEKTHMIPYEADASFQYGCIAKFGDKIVCAPASASSLLVIDGETEKISLQPCITKGNRLRWNSFAQCGSKLFCCPGHAESILILEDRRNELTYHVGED